MADVQKADLDAGAKDQTPTKDSDDSAKEQPDRSTELEARLTDQGRKLKAAEEARKAAEGALETEKSERQRLWLEHEATEAQKAEARAERERKSKEAPEVTRLINELVLVKAIAVEEDPLVKTALSKLYKKASDTGRYPDPAAIEALRESLTESQVKDEGDKKQEPKKKELPDIKASRGTRSSNPTIDEQIAEVKQSIQKRDGRFEVADLLPLMQEKQRVAREALG